MNFDKKVKKIIEKNIDTIPDNINKRIDNELKALGDKKKKKSFKKVSMVAGIVLLLGAVGITTTAVANGVPVSDVIFDVFGFDDDYKKYATEINQIVEAYGIKGTVTSAVHDGYKMTINFRMEGKNIEEIKEKTLPQIKIEGEENQGYEASYRMEIENENTIIGTYEVDLSDVNVKEGTALGYKENIDIEFILGQYKPRSKDFKEGLKFKIKATDENVKEEVKVYQVNKEIEEGIINEVIVTPFKIYIKGEKDLKYNQKIGSGEGKEREQNYTEPLNIYNEYVIEDAKGIRLKYETSNFQTARPDFTIQFENKFKDLSKINLIKLDTLENEQEYYDGVLEINDNKAQIKMDGNIEILECEKKDDTVRIKYKITDPLLAYFSVDETLEEGDHMKERKI